MISIPENETIEKVADKVGLGDRFRSEPTSVSDINDYVTSSFDGDKLLLNVSYDRWDLERSDLCRALVVSKLQESKATELVIERDGIRYLYDGNGVELLARAGRFVDQLPDSNRRLMTVAKRDPLSAISELETRTGNVVNVGIESGLLDIDLDATEYSELFSPTLGLTIAGSYVDMTVPEEATLETVRTLDSGTTIRTYSRPSSIPLYVVDLVDLGLTEAQRSLVVDGYEAIADGRASGERSASIAMNLLTDEPFDPKLTTVLHKHTRGYGILEDLFSDPHVSDVYATGPVSSNPLRVIVDGELMETNVHLTESGAESIGSRIRHESGRAFSRATPSVDSTTTLACGVGVRIAGVTDPVSTGTAFAFRRTSDDRFTLPALVANETLSAQAAAFLSVAVEKNAATLVAGTRGAGKTTLLGTLLYELGQETRTVVIEDTPELPVEALQSVDRDVQPMRTGTGTGPEITPAEALRTALRLGDGALVVGEIRGEEAQVLYEAMRVGANANAVMGTIHGDGAADVYERVVSDLNVPPSSFGTTDLVITCQSYQTSEMGRIRRVAAIEEVITSGEEVTFAPLYTLEGHTAVPTGRIAQGESRFVNRITGPTETYSDVRAKIRMRKQLISTLAQEGRTSPDEVAIAYATHRRQ